VHHGRRLVARVLLSSSFSFSVVVFVIIMIGIVLRIEIEDSFHRISSLSLAHESNKLVDARRRQPHLANQHLSRNPTKIKPKQTKKTRRKTAKERHLSAPIVAKGVEGVKDSFALRCDNFHRKEPTG